MNESQLITYHAGFSSHLTFNENNENLEKDSTLKPLNKLILKNNPNFEFRNAYLGWCSLFLLTNDSELFYLSYNATKNTNIIKTNCNLKNPFDLKSLECNNKETYLICNDRKVKCWPSNILTEEPFLVNQLMDEKIKVKEISVGSTFVCALLENGIVKAIDEEGSCVEFKLDNDEFEFVACGHEHVLLLSKKGIVYSYGSGGKGQLGHGDVEDVLEDCKIIQSLEGVRIIQVAAGSWHSIALSEFGDVFCWGFNESYQLGIESKSKGIIDLPTLINVPKDLTFITISCGSRHSMALEQKGILWVWGWNKYGQLGIDTNQKEVEIPQKVNLKGKVVSINCKFWASLIQIYYS